MAKLSKQAVERTLKVVNDVYKEFEPRLTKKVYVYQELRDIIELGLSDPNKDLGLTEEDKKRLETYKASGVLDETEEVPDWDVAKEYTDEIDRRIMEMVEKKELPKLSLAILKKKARKYDRKKQANTGSNSINSELPSGETKDATERNVGDVPSPYQQQS